MAESQAERLERQMKAERALRDAFAAIGPDVARLLIHGDIRASVCAVEIKEQGGQTLCGVTFAVVATPVARCGEVRERLCAQIDEVLKTPGVLVSLDGQELEGGSRG